MVPSTRPHPRVMLQSGGEGDNGSDTGWTIEWMMPGENEGEVRLVATSERVVV